MNDRWVYDKPNAANIPSRELLTTDDESPILHLSHVFFLGLGFLQGNHMEFDAPSSFEKSVKIGVAGDCSGVVGADHETVSMACRGRVVFVRNQRRPTQPEI